MYMDNGYSKWKENKKIMNQKRFSLYIKIFPILFILLFVVFFFGYNKPLFSKEKLLEFIPGTIGMLFLTIIFTFIKYPYHRYKPICNQCGKMIKNMKKDCDILDIKYIGTVDKIAYQKKTSKIKGKTVYPRGGYSMRNELFEYQSESTYEIEQNIPAVKKYYLYDITYGCKQCHEPFVTMRKESDKPINEKRKNTYE